MYTRVEIEEPERGSAAVVTYGAKLSGTAFLYNKGDRTGDAGLTISACGVEAIRGLIKALREAANTLEVELRVKQSKLEAEAQKILSQTEGGIH